MQDQSAFKSRLRTLIIIITIILFLFPTSVFAQEAETENASSQTDKVNNFIVIYSGAMLLGETQQATAFVSSPMNATTSFTWETSDPKILTVDETGKIQAAGVGQASVICTATNGGVKQTCTITVSEKEVESITVEPKEIWVVLGDDSPYDLKVTVLPENANQSFTWTNNKDGDVHVIKSEDGTSYKIDSWKLGTFTEKVRAINNLEDTLTVHVCSPTESLTLTPASKNLQVGEELTLNTAVKPDTASQKMTWSSSDDKIASVKDGKVTAVGAGKATITATSIDGKTASCTVTVTNPTVYATSISISKTSLTLTTGESSTIGAKVYPVTADPGIKWSSSDENIATVNEGVIIAKKAGSASITATSADGKAKATCQVTVKDKSSQDKTVTVYRLYNPSTGEHLYTTDKHEKDVLYQYHGWGYEGIGWYAPSSGDNVYRLYQPGLDNHLYTTDINEVNVLTSKYGWKQDNNGDPLFYSGGSIEIYRVYNPNPPGMHHLTTAANEYQTLPKFGWKQEGIKLKAQALGTPTKSTLYFKK